MYRFLLGSLAAMFGLTLLACSDNNDDLGELAPNVLVFTEHEIPAFIIQDAIERGDEDP
ncbi:MAG: hypothetical protein U5K56_13165 [Halioglobus sp.]|nr:hypothetical protein [Halioglobus sp.]